MRWRARSSSARAGLNYAALGGAAVDPLALPLSLMAGVTNGGYWNATRGANTDSSWEDLSGLGNDLTRTTVGSDDYFLTTGLDGRACYTKQALATGIRNFTLPSLSINRRAHAWWAVYRARSLGVGSDSGIASFGAGLTDALYDFGGDASAKALVWGTSMLTSTIRGQSSLVLHIGSASASATTLRINGAASSVAALSAGTLTGGRFLSRTDGFALRGEVYELGLMDRVLTAQEITDLEAYAQSRYGAWPTYGQIVIAGDSLTEGQNATTSLGWPNILDNNLRADYLQRSWALGGGNLQTQIAANAGNQALAYDGTLTKNIALCAYGTNDLGAGRTGAQLLGDMQSWLTTFKTAGFLTAMATITARDDVSWSGAKETERLAVNAGIPGLDDIDLVLDFAGISEMSNPANTTYFSADKIHYADAAFPVIEAYVRPLVLAL
jgi:hypothetical protein